MTEEGIFLGGGNEVGKFVDWTIPNIWGQVNSVSPAGNFDILSPIGAIYNLQKSNKHTDFTEQSAGSWNNAVGGFGFDIDKLGYYTGHTNLFGKMYPKHHNVEYWIKYK